MNTVYILTIVTYLGGSAWGPQVQVVPNLPSEKACRTAEKEVHALIDELNKSNIAGGKTHMREIVKTSCRPAK